MSLICISFPILFVLMWRALLQGFYLRLDQYSFVLCHHGRHVIVLLGMTFLHLSSLVSIWDTISFDSATPFLCCKYRHAPKKLRMELVVWLVETLSFVIGCQRSCSKIWSHTSFWRPAEHGLRKPCFFVAYRRLFANPDQKISYVRLKPTRSTVSSSWPID